MLQDHGDVIGSFMGYTSICFDQVIHQCHGDGMECGHHGMCKLVSVWTEDRLVQFHDNFKTYMVWHAMNLGLPTKLCGCNREYDMDMFY